MANEEQARSRRRRNTRSRRLADRLRDEIAAGRWPVGSPLPSITDLAATHDVAFNTARRALSQLADEGLVLTKPRSGSYVLARPMPRHPASSVGLVIPNNRYYDTVVDGISGVLQSEGINLMVACAGYDLATEITQSRQFVDAGVRGLLIAPTLHLTDDPSAHLDGFATLGVPHVLVERHPVNSPADAPSRRTPFVCSNVIEGVYQAICHLYSQGRRRIGYQGLAKTSHADEAFAGYQSAMAALDLPTSPPIIERRASWDWPATEVAQYARIAVEHNLDAIFCMDENLALKLVPQLRGEGVEVPEKIAIATFNDEVAGVSELPLTSVVPHRAEVGRLAARALVDIMSSDGSPSVAQTWVLPELVVRTSTLGQQPHAPHDKLSSEA